MDNLTPAQRHKNMQNIRSKNTIPEKIFSKLLIKAGYKFSRNVKSIFGTPDIVFKKARVAIFVDSDFWHGNPKLFKMPKSNRKFWKEKIQGNIKRDKIVNKELKKQGWTVVRIWEHKLRHNKDKCLNRVIKHL